MFGTSIFLLPESHAACVTTAQSVAAASTAATVLNTPVPSVTFETSTATAVSTPVLVQDTCGGDDVSYQVALPTAINFQGVEYNAVYATTNSTIVFGTPDNNYSNFPNTPSISVNAYDWVVLDPNNPNPSNAYPAGWRATDEHLIITSSQAGFQVDLAVRPYGANANAVPLSTIVVTAAINADNTLTITYLSDVQQNLQTRTGVRLPDGRVVSLEEAGLTRVYVAPVVTADVVTPAPEPISVPTPTPSPSPSVEPTPTPSPVPVPEPSPTPTVEPSIVPSPSPTATPEPSPLLTSTPVLPEPSATPSPVDTSTPVPVQPTPLPTPTPQPTPLPEPVPVPPAVEVPVAPVAPTPAPVQEPVQVQPDPVPEPPVVAPLPEPSPEPAPQPEPEPAPVPVEEPPAPAPEPEPVPVEQEQPAPEPDAPPVEPPAVEPEPPVAIPDPEPVPVEEPPAPEPEVVPVPVTPPPASEPASKPPVVAPEPPVVATVNSTPEERAAVAETLIENAQGAPVTAQAIAEAGLEYKDLPPATPVEVREDENGNEVVITAEVAAALVVLENPAALVSAIFTDPGQALLALASIGADMSVEERKESKKIILASVIAGQAAVTAVGSAGAYRRKP